MERYCMYLRKSRKDDDARVNGENDEETLARHEKALWELAYHQGLNVTYIHREVVSGETIDARPVMQQLLREVEQSMWAGVLVMEVERLARGDTADQGRIAKAFKYSETLIVTPNKTYDPNNEFDEEYFEFGLFMSRRELKTITRRLQEGRKRSALEGKFAGNKAPYGYKRVKLLKEKGFTLEAVPEEADVVRMIFDLYTVGEAQPDGINKRLGTSLIAKRLNQLKIPTKADDIWVTSSVRDMLINPTYIGKIRWNWRPTKKKVLNGVVVIERPRAGDYILAEGLHKGIVSAEVFEAAQEYMKENPARPIGERNTVKNPLAGLVTCGMCGRRMNRRPYSNGYPDTLMCAVPECKNVSSHLSLVETKILEGLNEWLAEYKLKWRIEGEPVKRGIQPKELKQKALGKVITEIETLNKQLNNTYDLLEQGVYTVEVFKQRSIDLENRIKKSQEDMVVLEADLKTEEIREKSRTTIIPKIEKLIETYHALPTPQAKNDLLKEVLGKVEYTKKKGSRWHTSPDDFEIILYPRIPRSNP